MNDNTGDKGLGTIVQTVARWLTGLILTYGVYVILHGHVTPGGAFEGGVIIAGGFILLALASGPSLETGQLRRRAAVAFNSAGILLFLALAWAGMSGTGGVFFRNFVGTPEAARFTLLSGGTIPVSNIALGLLVASSLFLVFAVLATFQIAAGRGKRERDEQ